MITNLYIYYDVHLLQPVTQALIGDSEFWEEFTSSFNQGLDLEGFYIAIAVLLGLLLAIYLMLKTIPWLFEKSSQEEQKYTILESVRSNLKLNEKQKKYLSALIEKFKDRSPYDPEVSTEYLREFLFYIIQNLSYAPKRSIRRKTHYVPDFKKGHSIDLMLKLDSDHYTTLQSEILEQNEDTVTVKKPPSDQSDRLKGGKTVSVAYKKGKLTLRGDANISRVYDDKVTLSLSNGMHFEEKRTYERKEVDGITAQLILQEWEGDTLRYEGTLDNISLGGAQIKFPLNDNRVHQNMRGHIQMELGDNFKFDLEIVVIHVENSEETMTVGLEFTDPGIKDRNRLHEYISEDESDEIRT